MAGFPPQFGLRQTTAPAAEPVLLAEAKTELGITHTADDSKITAYLTTARMWCEEYTKRQFITARWSMFLPDFPRCGDQSIWLPRPPFSFEATAYCSVSYYDTAGAFQTLTVGDEDFRVDHGHEPVIVMPNLYEVWPGVKPSAGYTQAVEISWEAGYGTAGTSVPRPIRQAILLMVRKLLDSPTDEGLVTAIKMMLDPYRIVVM